jgi:nicotinate-nucleotide--dimethylbenzimidazole phosphoribosyltransferase
MTEIAVRTVLRVVDGIGLYIVGLIVMLATGQRRQRLGDMAAGTIIVDASAPPAMPPAPVAAPIDEAPADEEPEEETASASTITLPSRPVRPATLDDLSTTEAPPVPEMRPFDPPLVEDEPEPVEDEAAFAAAEPVEPAFEAGAPVEDEAVEAEPSVPVHEPVEDAVAEEPVEDAVAVEPVEDEPVAEEPLPDVSTPAIEELRHDVEAARSEPVPVQRTEDEPADDEPITLRSVETVSAIDLVMGGAAEEDDSSEQDQDPEPPAAS